MKRAIYYRAELFNKKTKKEYNGMGRIISDMEMVCMNIMSKLSIPVQDFDDIVIKHLFLSNKNFSGTIGITW